MLKKDLTLLKEGLVDFYIYNIDKGSIPSKSMNVFYNKKMEINRDITTLAINAYSDLYDQKNLIIIDSMAASGISSIRILRECKNIKKIFINDINPGANKLIKKNIKLNSLNKAPVKIIITQKDANLLFSEIITNKCKHLNQTQKKPNIISIDPFGTPNLYIDSAFKTIQKTNGLICITATDTAVLFGVRPNVCIRKYFAKPLHTEYCKEIGGRILIYFLSRIANINKIGIIPLLTFYSGHFIRVFCATFKNQEIITKYFKNFGYIIHCNNCGYRSSFGNDILELPKECPLCANKIKLDYAGPLWIGKIHKINFIKKMLNLNENFKFSNKKRIEKLLLFAIEENNMPISYYNLHKLCQNLKLTSVPKIKDVISVIKENGYHSSRTHFDFLSIKMDSDIFSLKKILTDIQK
ncbi:MAG: tRNA (guanine(10)-N(2))-dimethyltransferase [Candidatus Lokiarchaeota archaeon]|nr:tRNA (guanine(10)-N(2))-dimethyltransferase [Candidatus Lokiarchaeota archaeon]